MTDEQIVKALELCFSEDFGKCEECPLKNQKDEVFTCIKSKQIFALDLINKQKAELKKKDIEIDILIRKKETAYDECEELKAEIERLKEDNNFHIRLEALLVEQRDGRDKLVEQIDAQNDELRMKLKTAKSEAIKEFWDKLKEKGTYLFPKIYYEAVGLKQRKIYTEEAIENTLKELTDFKG